MIDETGLVRGADGKDRCWWHGGHEDYQHYHDQEWGLPIADSQRLFEKLCLEGFQSGLSWLTILRKRENFRAAFANFEAERLIKFSDDDISRLLTDTGIVRHRGKIKSVFNNAKRVLELGREGESFAAFVWSFEPNPATRPTEITYARLTNLTKTPESTALSLALKKGGWSFVGPTTVYAFMQSVGIVNDHLEGCWMRPVIEAERRAFKKPI
ncbi:MAG: DNA-3-methyladenine glycosylase I [Cyanobacteria bacterium J06638_22]